MYERKVNLQLQVHSKDDKRHHRNYGLETDGERTELLAEVITFKE